MTARSINELWKNLSKQQLGKYAEYFVKMSFLRHRWSVYSPEIDDQSVDFVTTSPGDGTFYRVQVKSLRGPGYAFMKKRLFTPHETSLVVLAIFGTEPVPDLYLIPSTVWLKPDKCFVSRDYGADRKSEPEWGIQVTTKHLASRLVEFTFNEAIDALSWKQFSN
jgi:hypothetical protein